MAPIRWNSRVASRSRPNLARRWLTTFWTDSSSLSLPKARRFWMVSASRESPVFRCGTTKERRLRASRSAGFTGWPRSPTGTRLILPLLYSMVTVVVVTPSSWNRPRVPIRPGW
ncbi:hypothetical protein D9M69_682980 [compost metagenome]